jgi:Bacterial Ig-like domain
MHLNSRVLVLFILLPALTALSCGGGGGGSRGGGSDSPYDGFRVTDTEPFDTELAVQLSTTVAIVFSEEIDPDTLTADSFRVWQSYTGNPVIGALTLADDRMTAELVPTTTLTLNTEYQVLVTTDIESRLGERLRKDFTAAFHTVVTNTGPPPPPPPPPTGRLETVGSMVTGRSSHTATRLSTDQVLVAAGWKSSTEVTGTAELYNPETKAFSQLTNGLWTARGNHTATLLQSGKVLITGGYTNGGAGVTAKSEIYDPGAGTFAMGPDMTQPRVYHAALVLADGTVLITGGGQLTASSNLVSTRSAELYDPSTNTFIALSNMAGYRSDHVMTRLNDGKILITGGSYSNKAAEIYDPVTKAFGTTTGEMKVARSGHSATRLVGGSVLLYGGGDRSATIYTAGISRFDSTPGVPLQDRTSHTATGVTGGRVIIAGGYVYLTSLMVHATLEYFNGPPGPKTFVPSQATLTYPLAFHRATLLRSGDILYTGGINLDPSGLEAHMAYLYTFK